MSKQQRGFASMDPKKQREIASKGGKAAHEKGTGHEWTKEEAREAGRKGGMVSHQHLKGGVPVARGWIDEGLRHTRERDEQQRLASERRLHQTAVIKEKGPDLMRRLAAEVGTIVDEYRHEARVGSNEIEFEALPREGFCVTKIKLPSAGLECRPDYEAHVVYCNMTRTDNHESDTQEWVFSLDITVDDSDKIALRHDTRPFQTLDEVVEFLLKPVLFPPLNQDR